MSCDHIVGIIRAADPDPEELVRKTDFDNQAPRLHWPDFRKFAFCPLCGERVNGECDVE